jgi:hypothetical protein
LRARRDRIFENAAGYIEHADFEAFGNDMIQNDRCDLPAIDAWRKFVAVDGPEATAAARTLRRGPELDGDIPATEFSDYGMSPS